MGIQFNPFATGGKAIKRLLHFYHFAHQATGRTYFANHFLLSPEKKQCSGFLAIRLSLGFLVFKQWVGILGLSRMYLTTTKDPQTVKTAYKLLGTFGLILPSKIVSVFYTFYQSKCKEVIKGVSSCGQGFMSVNKLHKNGLRLPLPHHSHNYFHSLFSELDLGTEGR